MLRRNIIFAVDAPPMMSAALHRSPLFDVYAESLAAAERATRFWGEVYRTSADFALWWADRWLQAPSALAAWTPAPEAVREAVSEVAEAAAASAAAPALIAAAALPEPCEPAAAPVLDTAGPDDLTRIVGVGPRLAALLAERGVTSFAQIAEWTDAEIAEVDRALSLKGRIARNGWVIQARRLAGGA